MWKNILVVDSAAYNGIVFNGDIQNAALAFQQPHGRVQPIKWRYANGAKEASLTVSPEDGVMKFEGGGLAIPGGLINLKGLSGTALAAQNLRGIHVVVPAGSREFTVKLPKSEPDAAYAIFIEPNWLTGHAVTSQTDTGFTIAFETAAPTGAKLHWLLVR